MTLVKLLERNAELIPDKTAIIYRGIKTTYAELNDNANRVAHALIGAGVMKGDRIGLMLPRVPELIIGFLGIAKAHAVAVPVNFELLEKGIRDILAKTSPRCIIVHKQYLELARKAVPADAKILIVTVGGENKANELSWAEMLGGCSADNPSLEIGEDDVVYLNYTSGTAGNPKCAVTTHSNIYWNTDAAVKALKLKSEDIHLCMFAPHAHPHELFARPFYLGGTMVLLDTIYPRSIAEAIAFNGVTCMMGLSPMYEMLLETIKDRPYDLGSLRIPESGGMYTSMSLIRKFRSKTGVPILAVWGSTETTGIAVANTPEEDVPGSIGKPCPAYEVRIVDNEGREVGVGEIGEMIFSGPAVVKCYYEDHQNSRNCFEGGWYYSGDLGRRDEDGNLFFVDRKSGMMKVAGLKVYPMEIERVLMDHPQIKEVAVISAKDRLRGEVPKAMIVAANGKNLNEKDIIKFCRGRMPHYKIPRIVEFRESLPKMGSGKFNRKELQLEELSKP